jgi:hypothetical protein
MNLVQATTIMVEGNSQKKKALYSEIRDLHSAEEVQDLIALYSYSDDAGLLAAILLALKQSNSQEANDFLSLQDSDKRQVSRQQYLKFQQKTIDQMLSFLDTTTTSMIPAAWEYCVVGPIKTHSTTGSLNWWRGNYPVLTYFAEDGMHRGHHLEIAEEAKKTNISEDDLLRAIVAKLGNTGWEMVGFGPVEHSDGSSGSSITMHYIYFKRRK